MNIYKVTLDKFDYDEYDSFVVYAESAASAEDIVMDKVNKQRVKCWQQVESVELLGSTDNLSIYSESGIILGSFNAG